MARRYRNKPVIKKTAVLYARYSSKNQRDESIDAQIRLSKEYAEREGFTIIGIYADAAKTGRNTDREQFQQMLRDSASGKFSYVIVHKLDRLTRTASDLTDTEKILAKNGVTLLSVIEPFDDSPEGEVMKGISSIIGQYTSRNIGREVMKGMTESALKATHLGGCPPLGYDVDYKTKKYFVNEAEASIVRTIFDMYANGEAYNRILRYLNGMGYRTKRGNQFGKNSLSSILTNEKYVGRYIFNKRQEKTVEGKRNPTLKPKEEWIVIEGGIPAIIDQETFDAVQEKLSKNKRKSGSFKAKETYLLSGLIFCSECGEAMHGNKHLDGRKKSNYSSYRCHDSENKLGYKNKET